MVVTTEMLRLMREYGYKAAIDSRDPAFQRLMLLLYKLGIVSAGKNLPVGFHE